MQSQRNYGSVLSKSDLHVMIKNTMPTRNCPKGKGPILTIDMQMAAAGGVFEKWPFSLEEVGFLLRIRKTVSIGNNSSLSNLVFLLILTLLNN